MDNLTPEQRKKNMQKIRSNNTLLENSVTKELWKKGFRIRKNSKKLFGKPDISIKKYKVVIFIDSCFWHMCPIHCNIPSSNQEYWISKLNRNKTRDIEVTKYYIDKDWNILRIWEHEIRIDYTDTIEKIVRFIQLSIDNTEKHQQRKSSLK